MYNSVWNTFCVMIISYLGEQITHLGEQITHLGDEITDLVESMTHLGDDNIPHGDDIPSYGDCDLASTHLWHEGVITQKYSIILYLR